MTSDIAFIFEVCGGIILLPIVAVLGVWYFRRISSANVKTTKRMGSEWLFMNKDGSVDIHPPRTFNVIAIVIIWFFVEMFALAITVGSNANGVITGILVLGITVAAGVGEWYVVQANRFRLDPHTKMLTIRHGSTAQTITFNSIKGLVVTYAQVVMHTRYGTSISYVAGMTFALDNGGAVVIGAPGGSEKNIQQHAHEIVDILNDVLMRGGAHELVVEYQNTELN